MDINDKFIGMLCHFLSILQMFSVHSMTQETTTSKALQTPELNPVAQVQVDPFPKPGQGKQWRGFKERKTGHREREVWTGEKTHDEGDQEHNDPLSILQPITNIRRLKAISELLENLKMKLRQLENSIALEPLEKFFKHIGKTTQKKAKTVTTTTSRINNPTYNSQYQIENIFIINRLSRENISGTDAESFDELTARKIEELLENYLKKDGMLEGDAPPFTRPPAEMDFLKRLQSDFPFVFPGEDSTTDRLDQIAKIIDFVQKYHGTVADFHVERGKKRKVEMFREVYESGEEAVARRKGSLL